MVIIEVLQELCCGYNGIMVLLVNAINVCYGTFLRVLHGADHTELFLLLFVQCVGIADGDTGKSVLSISFAQLDCTRALSYRSSRASRSGTPVLMHLIVLCFQQYQVGSC